MGWWQPDPPKAPDPDKTAAAQTGLNIGTAVANQTLGNVNQVTPQGSLTYSQSGMTQWTDPLSGKVYDLPQMTATQTLSPEQQKLYDINTGTQTNLAMLGQDQSKRLGSILGTPFNTDGAPGVSAPNLQMLGGGPNLREIGSGPNLRENFGAGGPITKTYGDKQGYADQRQKVEDALMARINPQLEADRSAAESRLANSGVGLGSKAYDRAQGNLGQNANDARLGAILGAGEEQSRLAGLDRDRAMFQNAAQGQRFGQNYTRAGFMNEARQQEFQNRFDSRGFNNAVNQQEFGNQQVRVGFNNSTRQQDYGNDRQLRGDYLSEQYAARNQPLNEISALMNGGQVTQPNFMSMQGPQTQPVDYSGLVGQNYAQKLGAYNAQQANNPLNGLMGGLFGLGQAAIMPSDRRLKRNVTFLGMLRDLPVYAYEYVWGGPRRIGVMAQDMLTIRPEAVLTVGGFLAVDYGKL
jgi:hypothetical protein